MAFHVKLNFQTIISILVGFVLVCLILLSALTFLLLNVCLTTLMISFIVALLTGSVALIPIFKFLLIPWFRRQCRSWTINDRQSRLSIGFFHPYCNDGGGGERVLWTAIESILKKYRKEIEIVIYTGDRDATPNKILQRVQRRFDMNMKPYENSITFIYLRSRFFVEAKYYPMFTLLGQSIGSMILGFEALFRFIPDIYIDSMGYAFTFPIFHYLASVPVLAYVHYPTISTDMLEQVRERRPTYNNRRLIADSAHVSRIKLIYYRIFAFLYGSCGKCAQIAYCNSSWTRGHIEKIWTVPKSSIHLVYPPCDVKQFLAMPLVKDDEQTVKTIVSVGQFRPEKDHELQIRSFHELLQRIPDERRNLRLILIGSVRHIDDQRRVEQLRTLVENLNMTDEVQFELNINFPELKRFLNQATIGLHTMWNEHFGIGIVEMMAAGAIVLAHQSGGPKMDIVSEGETGFLASDIDSYATMMRQILEMNADERRKIRERARESVDRFSVTNFETRFMEPLNKVILNN